MALRGVLLDIDGTLLDSNRAHARAYVAAFAAEGMVRRVEDVQPLIGMGSDKLLPALGIEPGSRAAEHITRTKTARFMQDELPRLTPQRGSRDLLLSMKKHGLSLTVATSAKAGELGVLLSRARVEDLITSQTTSSDAASSKPDPDIVLAAIARSGLPREALLMVGDTRYDIEAAKRAGLPVIAVLAGGSSLEDLEDADEVYDDPADLLAHYDESLLARP